VYVSRGGEQAQAKYSTIILVSVVHMSSLQICKHLQICMIVAGSRHHHFRAQNSLPLHLIIFRISKAKLFIQADKALVDLCYNWTEGSKIKTEKHFQATVPPYLHALLCKHTGAQANHTDRSPDVQQRYHMPEVRWREEKRRCKHIQLGAVQLSLSSFLHLLNISNISPCVGVRSG